MFVNENYFHDILLLPSEDIYLRLMSLKVTPVLPIYIEIGCLYFQLTKHSSLPGNNAIYKNKVLLDWFQNLKKNVCRSLTKMR